MSSLLQENLEALSTYRADLYERVISFMENQDASNISIIQAANGTPNLIITSEGNQPIHMYSKYNPEHECMRWAETIDPFHKESHIIMYGLGLGFHFNAYVAINIGHSLYIYEPDIKIFIESLKVISLQSIIKHPSFKYLAVGDEPIEQEQLYFWYHTYANQYRHLVAIPYYTKRNKGQFEQFSEKLRIGLMNHLSSEQYAQSLGKFTLHNTLRNFTYILKTPSLAGLKGSLNEKEAVIIGAGPSLENEIELLKSLQDQMLLIASGSSVQTLIHYGIEPHLIVSMDAGRFNYNIFKKKDLNHIPLLVIPQIHHQIMKERTGTTLHAFFSHDPFIQCCFDLSDNDPLFIGTHSVTGTAIQAAIYMGCNRVILVGQDLSFPNQSLYAEGASHLSADAIKDNQLQITETVANVKGGLNPTSTKMKITLNDIERLIASYPDVQFINTTNSGAMIKGTTWLPLSEAAGFSKITYNKLEFQQDITRFAHVYPEEYQIKVRDNCNLLLQQLGEIEKHVIKVEALLSKLPELSRTNPNKCMKYIGEIESQWGEAVHSSLFKTILSEWMKSELYTYDRQVNNIAKELNLIAKTKLMVEIVGTFITKLKKELPIIMREIRIQMEKIQP
ncbi:motility associated factor glycosyltransferase family protein [Paenibacillus sp. IITD108]|uniref:motility associated factor glycosyltransferase family protein n=1 Tax=Paenibacillus sp. IITD108 TaxID=3116649 RepID=UPI002F40B92D